MKKILYEGIGSLSQLLGLRQSQHLGQALGRIMWYLLPGRRKLATRAIQKHLDLGLEESRKLAKDNFQRTGCSFFELFLNRQVDFRFAQNNVRIIDPEGFFHILRQKRPIVLVSGHLGSWELLAGVISLYSQPRPTQAVMHFSRNQELNRLLTHFRQKSSTEVISNRKTTTQIVRHLKRNGMTGFLVDHNCTRRKALFLPFLQDTAAVNKGPATLAYLTKALVWPVFVIRTPCGGFELHHQTPLDSLTLKGDKTDIIRQISLFYTRVVQEMVYSYPEQWFWMHNRWKTRPKPGQA